MIAKVFGIAIQHDDEASGFRRLTQWHGAALVPDLAPILDPEHFSDETVTSFGVDQAAALKKLDNFASAHPLDTTRRQELAANASQAVAFVLALDVAADEPRAMWRAVVSRAFAAADAVAWGQAAGRTDDEVLRVGGEKIGQILNDLEPVADDVRGALRRRRFADAAASAEFDRRLLEGLLAFRDLAEYACNLAGIESEQRRRPPAWARSYFVLRLASVFAVLTGTRPSMNGGDEHRLLDDPRAVRKRDSRWHEFINAALDLTATRGTAVASGNGAPTATSTILDVAREMPAARQLDDLAGWPESFTNEERRRGLSGRHEPLHYADFEFSGIEMDAGIDPAHQPTTRADAYQHPAAFHRGRTGEG